MPARLRVIAPDTSTDLRISGRRRGLPLAAAFDEFQQFVHGAIIEHGRVDLTPLVAHHFALDDIVEAFALFSEQRGGVLKVALYPDGVPHHRRMLEAVGACARSGMLKRRL